MGIYHGKDSRIYVSGYDIGSLAVGVTPVQEIEVKPYAVMDGTGGYHQLRGLAKDALSIDGLFDDNYMAVLTALFSATSGYQVMIPFGITDGSRGLAVDAARLRDYKWKSVVTDINKLTGEVIAENLPFDEVKMIRPKATVTGNGTGTIFDESAASTSGGVGYLQVFAFTGTNITISIRHSTDNFVADDSELLAFTIVAGITTERKTATGAVSRYIRAQWTGTFTSCSFAVAWKRY